MTGVVLGKAREYSLGFSFAIVVWQVCALRASKVSCFNSLCLPFTHLCLYALYWRCLHSSQVSSTVCYITGKCYVCLSLSSLEVQVLLQSLLCDFIQIPSQCMTCVKFQAFREHIVGKTAPVPIKVYDYYEPGRCLFLL